MNLINRPLIDSILVIRNNKQYTNECKLLEKKKESNQLQHMNS